MRVASTTGMTTWPRPARRGTSSRRAPAALLLTTLFLAATTHTARAALAYEPDPRRAVAQAAEAMGTLAVPERETWNVRPDTQLYVSRLNDACPDDDEDDARRCGVLLNVHAGFLLEGSRFNVGAAATWLANSYSFAVYSVGYRLASQGATYAQTLDDIRVAVAWLREQHPTRPLVVVGASMGAGLVLSLLRANDTMGTATTEARPLPRPPPHIDLAVLDSPYACMQTFETQAEANAHTRALIDNLGKKPSESPIWAYPTRRGEELTPECGRAPRVPTVVLHSELDPIVPYEQSAALRGLPNVTACLAPGGVHVQTLSTACRSILAERMDADTRVAADPSEWRRAVADVQAEAAYEVATVATRLAPAQVVLAYLCVVSIDPLLYEFLDCEVRRRRA